MRILEFDLPIEPKAQMRARHNSVNGFSVTHKATKQKHRELQLMELLEKHKPKKPLEGEISLVVVCNMPIPDSKPQWWKGAAISGMIKHTSKPDLDNMIKHIKDCLQTMGFYKNDSQVCHLIADKRYSETPSWEIGIIEQRIVKKKKEYDEIMKGGE